MEKLLSRISSNTTGSFSKKAECIAVVDDSIARIIGDSKIYISEFIIAKIKGKIPALPGHTEITDRFFLRLPKSLHFPFKILKDTRGERKFLFIAEDPLHEIVVEVVRKESGKTEINTIHLISEYKLKRLEHKFPIVYSSGGTS